MAVEYENASDNPNWTFDELVAAIFEPYDEEGLEEIRAGVDRARVRGHLLRFPVTLYIVKRSELPDPPSEGSYLPVDEDSCWCLDEIGLHEISSDEYRELGAANKVGHYSIDTWVWHRFTDGYRFLNTWRTHRRHGESTRSRIVRGNDGKVMFVDTVTLGHS